MAFDQATRNKLQNFVTNARALLKSEFTRQLQKDFGMDPITGEISDLDSLNHLNDTQIRTAWLLRDTLNHYQTTTPLGDTSQILDRIVREQGFTVLNRLCALRMAEARGILIESIQKGYHSKGFSLYARMAGTALGETGATYQNYLFSLFDEFSYDLPVLFDRYSPLGRLFPRESALLELLDKINDPELAALWAEDETIGWIYQYFNSVEERRQMRADSSAPRNSRELAVRNQFFTPRYVVEFLTDNTLGRIWYEMTRGHTGLTEQCRYLVRRPNEIFLKRGQDAPEPEPEPKSGETDTDLSQEELLKQPVYILHRPMKDPREILMLDPACGSMHFGLYAFDLFEKIYLEAWELQSTGQWPVSADNPMGLLTEKYATQEELFREIPRLIIEHNIHGVDIDPRAAQIAGLSLWLRAQRSWKEHQIKPGERSRILKSNIVCAEPMPGDATLLNAFSKKLKYAVLGQLLEIIVEKMELAGEAGSLLKIEEEIETAVEQAREEFNKEILRRNQASEFLPGMAPKQTQLSLFDFADLPSKTQFWETAEENILDALKEYAEHTEEGDGGRRRLFVEDAAKGFAFIDLCRKRYDVVLMNPPFGEFIFKSKKFFNEKHKDSISDIGMMFVDIFRSRLNTSGRLGAITNRTCLATSQLEKWRRKVFLGQSKITAIADLGYGVLDTAMVEACAYIIENNSEIDFFPGIRLLDSRNKESDLVLEIEKNYLNDDSCLFQYGRHKIFLQLPLSVISYWAPLSMLSKLTLGKNIGNTEIGANDGGHTGNDFRFIRAVWEIPNEWINNKEKYVFFAKGGEYSPFWNDIHLLEYWALDGKEIRQLSGARIYHENLYLAEGLTYPLRTTSDFSPRILPRGMMFSTGGHGIHFGNKTDLLSFLGLCYSRIIKVFVEILFGSGDASVSGSAARNYTAGTINLIPLPILDDDTKEKLSKLSLKAIEYFRSEDNDTETSRYFTTLQSVFTSSSIKNGCKNEQSEWLEKQYELYEILNKFEEHSFEAYGLNKKIEPVLRTIYGKHPSQYEYKDVSNEILPLLNLNTSGLIEEAIKSSTLINRSITKKSYFINRQIDLMCHILKTNPKAICDSWKKIDEIQLPIIQKKSETVLQYLLGITFGRWEINYANEEKVPPELPDPFAPLPVCPPGMLQNTSGLPAGPDDIPDDYPLRITWSGIIVDDEGHPEDIVTRIREAMEVIWKETAGDIEQEACEILNTGGLRDYFSKPAKFFADHLKRYSKSRRQAPIYWPLSTPSGSYTLWLYYHRLTDQTLYTCVNNFVAPKLEAMSATMDSLRKKTGRSATEEKELETLSNLVLELTDFKDELLRIAQFWKPDLNDGVVITAAPLWKLFLHKPWQKNLKQAWTKLEKGDYDWAHLACSIWPDRVIRASHKDRSYAIAHDLEEDLWEEEETGCDRQGNPKYKWVPKDLTEPELKTITKEKTGDTI